MLPLLVACTDPADRWLAIVARGDDAQAFALLEIGQPPPGGFDVSRFSKRVERVGLRDATDVVWTSRSRSGLRVRYEGTFEVDGQPVPLELGVMRGRITGVRVADEPLVPVQRYFVTPDRQPVGELVIPDLWARPGRFGLDVGGTTDAAGTLTVNGRCMAGERWVASAIVGQVQVPDSPLGTGRSGPFTLTVGDVEGSPCQLGLRFLDGVSAREAVVCWDGVVQPGPCVPAPAPDPTGPPVQASAIGARWRAGGVSVDYHLRANVPQPEPGSFEFAVVTTTVTCPGGKRPVTHRRPITADWLEPGVDRVLGSVLEIHAEARPCALQLDYVRDDAYDRVELPLFDGCADADGTVRPGAC